MCPTLLSPAHFTPTRLPFPYLTCLLHTPPALHSISPSLSTPSHLPSSHYPTCLFLTSAPQPLTCALPTNSPVFPVSHLPASHLTCLFIPSHLLSMQHLTCPLHNLMISINLYTPFHKLSQHNLTSYRWSPFSLPHPPHLHLPWTLALTVAKSSRPGTCPCTRYIIFLPLLPYPNPPSPDPSACPQD